MAEQMYLVITTCKGIGSFIKTCPKEDRDLAYAHVAKELAANNTCVVYWASEMEIIPTEVVKSVVFKHT